MSNKQKGGFQQGPDGKLYYSFALGAVYELRPEFGKPFSYTVTACEFENETEYYRIESAGKELPTRFSVKRLEEMLSRLPCERLEEGEYIELPLIREEVEAYFTAHRKEVSKANAAANKALKETAYFKNLTAIGTLKKSLCLYIAKNDVGKIVELDTKIMELEAEQAKILADKGVDRKILTKAPDCELCGDSGIVLGQICQCAYKQEAQIKKYNSEMRLRCRNAN